MKGKSQPASKSTRYRETFLLEKWKTTLQMIAIGFLLAGPAGDLVLPNTTEIGISLLWIAAIITLYTGYDYFRAGLRHIVD